MSYRASKTHLAASARSQIRIGARSSLPPRVYHRISAQYLVGDDRDALHFNQDPGECQIRNRNQGARRELAVREHLAAHLEELVAITRILEKDGHAHQVLKASSAGFQGAVHQRKSLPGLGLEVAHDLAVCIRRDVMACEPNDPAALGNYRRCVTTLLLIRVALNILYGG